MVGHPVSAVSERQAAAASLRTFMRHLVPGLVEGRPAILVFDPSQPGAVPKYFMLLQWAANKVAEIRDFRHAPYVIDGAEYLA
jgi:hypothetical protein